MKVLLIHADATTSFYPYPFPGAVHQTPLQIAESRSVRATVHVHDPEPMTHLVRMYIFRGWLRTKRDEPILAVYEEV